MAATGTVTPDGDIVIHNKGTFTYTVAFRDQLGAARDVSARNLYFVTNSGIRVMLLPGETNAQKRLVIPQETLKVALRVTSEFAIVDETDPLHVVEWSGRLHVKGW
mgnify:CR=1 FL=1